MNTCTLTLRCTLRSVVQQPQRTAYGLLCFSAKPVNPISHHSYSSILSKASTIRTPNVAVLKRNYASAPLTAQLQKTDREQTGNAGATSDSHTDKDQVPAYDLTFTCKKCLSRSTHRVSKQGFYKGTVLITCPGCKNRHLISDHLKVGYLYGLVPVMDLYCDPVPSSFSLHFKDTAATVLW